MNRLVTRRLSKSFLILLAISAGLPCSDSIIRAADQQPPSNRLTDAEKQAGWILLFDGQTLNGWKPNENPESFKVRDGMIVARGLGQAIQDQAPHPKCHLFYVGPEGKAAFNDFELQLDLKSEHHANSGIYFHTEYVENAWPQKGFEIQIDNDPAHSKKTGSLYAVDDITESPAKDNEWVHLQLTVQSKHVTIRLNNQKVVDWTEPDNFIVRHPPWFTERRLSSGTFALQGHDSDSTVYFKNIRVRPLASEVPKTNPTATEKKNGTGMP